MQIKKTLKNVLAMTLVLILALTPISNVFAAVKTGTSYKIKMLYNNDIITRKAINMNYNGKQISSGDCPSFIYKDNAYYSGYYVFGQSEQLKTLYKLSGSTITLTRYSKTLKMTLDSKTAYLNGKKVTLTTAPRKVYIYKTKKNQIMVPGKSCATLLGLSYTWNSSSQTSNVKAIATATTATTATTTTAKPAVTTTAKPTTTTTATTTATQPTVTNSKTTTSYDTSLSEYATLQQKAVPKYGSTSYSVDAYKKLITPSNTVGDYQFLRLDTYHNVDESAYAAKVNSLISSKTNSVLKDKGSALLSAAKSKKIDPIYFLSQTINESAYGTSTLSKKTITSVITGDSVKKDANGNVTGFVQVNGKYITKTIASTTVYNLYGIKAYDSDPQLCGSSYAYYMGWNTVDKAITGAAAYLSDNYVHNSSYYQNTLYKIRYNPLKSNIWHQYATNPTYASEIGTTMKSLSSLYSGNNSFVYDFPNFKEEVAATTAKPTTTTATTTTAKPVTTTVTYKTTGPLPNSKVKASSSNYDLRIKLPSGVTSYYREDKYTSRQLFISCAGNYKTYFSNASNRYAKSSMSSFTVTYNATKNRTYLYIKPSSSYRGYATAFSNGYAYVKWGTPKTMYKNIVVLDAGHGGTDTGACANGYAEKNMTLQIVLAAKSLFDSSNNYAVYYTRTTDTYPSLTARSALANDVGADYFISVHINSAGSTAVGTETLYNSNGYKATNGVTSYKLSTNTHNYIKAATGFTNRGLVNRTGLAVLRNTKTASTLTEIGFISNKAQAKKMDANLNNYGKAVYNSIVKMFSSNPSKR